MRNLFTRLWPRLLAAAAVATVAGALVAGDAHGQRARGDAERRTDRTFSPEVGEIAVTADEKLHAEPPDLRGAIADLDRALDVRGVSPYELGVILRMRGQAKLALDDAGGALADWSRALDEGDLAENERLDVMYNVGQLLLREEDYRAAVDRLEEWIRLGGAASDKVHLNLARAYVELGDPHTALGHGRQAYEKASPREKVHYDTLDFLYHELAMPAERATVLSEAVTLFPQEKRYWLVIAQLHAEAGRERKAFEINKIMYLNGMLTSESEVMRVVDYYSYYDVPYRGALILEREMNAGRVERSQANYEKLARLYRQANEFDRAVAPLEAAARMAPDGELYLALGEAYYAEARYGEAEAALLEATRKGGLEQPGEAWLLLGNARWEAEMPEAALEAFEAAERDPSTRELAREWAIYVRGEISAVRDRWMFELKVRKDELRVGCELRLHDIIIYKANRRDGDPDCEAIVDQRDFSSVPAIVEMEQAIIAEFGAAATD